MADDDPLIRSVLLYMRDNLHRPFGVEQVADGIGVSRSRLDKACLARFVRSLGKEILAARLEKAKALLLLKGWLLNIDNRPRNGLWGICLLQKKFKTAFGMTPRKWQASTCR